MDLRVMGLRVGQYLADEVYWMLGFKGVSLFLPLYYQGDTDHLSGGRYI